MTDAGWTTVMVPTNYPMLGWILNSDPDPLLADQYGEEWAEAAAALHMTFQEPLDIEYVRTSVAPFYTSRGDRIG